MTKPPAKGKGLGDGYRFFGAESTPLFPHIVGFVVFAAEGADAAKLAGCWEAGVRGRMEKPADWVEELHGISGAVADIADPADDGGRVISQGQLHCFLLQARHLKHGGLGVPVGVIAHESEHLATHLLARAGQPHHPDYDEVYASMTGWAAEAASRVVLAAGARICTQKDY